MTILNLSISILIGFIYSTLFFVSIIILPSLLIWRLSLLFKFTALIFISVLYAFLNEYKKIPLIPFLGFAMLFGFLIGNLFLFDSIQLINTSIISYPYLITDFYKVNYVFQPILASIITIFLIYIAAYDLFYSIKIYSNARDKRMTRGLIVNTILLTFPLIIFILYVIYQATVLRELYIIFLWIYYFSVSIVIIRKPEMFLVLTNKIYYIYIYHKSGILLASYKFEKEKDLLDSSIWGNILIGLNYIISEFIDKKDKIDVMHTKNSDIIVKYNNEFGFAVLAITNQKNQVLMKHMENFTNEFQLKYEKELVDIQDLNKIINVSDFEQTKNMIEKNFKIYL
ncbi:MAG: hypothetical protein EU539_08610 [Promethearchaeota archaeon]|nr:MAG: hypothetical protein EU539_08610 [Candidatus Lokiarchaeota archaeon]